MKRLFAASLAAFCCIAYSATPALPTATQNVNVWTEGAKPREGFARLRINLSSATANATEEVRLAGVAVCSTDVCYEAAVPSSLKIFNTAAGTSAPVVELEVPYLKISGVRFKTLSGPGILQGNVVLATPFNLEAPFRGADLMVLVQGRSSNGSASTYEPVNVVANYLKPEGTAIFYNPKFASTVKLPLGVTLTIPAGAYGTPQIFIGSVHDTGDELPLLDIYPALDLLKPATVSIAPAARELRAQSASQVPASPRPKAASPDGTSAVEAQASRAGATTTFDISSTGVIRKGFQAPRAKDLKSDASAGVQPMASAAVCNEAGWCNCADELAFPTNQQILANAVVPTGTGYVDWCTTIPPYVHITISNMADSRERFTIRHENYYINNGVNVMPLRTLPTWSPNTQAMINGFTWAGSKGLSDADYGRGLGYVHDFGFALGDNLPGGAICADVVSSAFPNCDAFNGDGKKRVFMVDASGPGNSFHDETVPKIITNTVSYVSSSTSIERDSVCTTDADVSSWSAIGETVTGKLVMMSSVSGTSTTAVDLCPVFKALGIVNAIRTDGATAASMTVDGIHKNPLTGMDAFAYGSARHVLYGLKVSYPGW